MRPGELDGFESETVFHLPVRREERFGYRQHPFPLHGWLVMVAGAVLMEWGGQAPLGA